MPQGLGSAVDISKDDILSAPSEMYTIVFAPSTTTVELVILLLKNVDWFWLCDQQQIFAGNVAHNPPATNNQNQKISIR